MQSRDMRARGRIQERKTRHKPIIFWEKMKYEVERFSGKITGPSPGLRQSRNLLFLPEQVGGVRSTPSDSGGQELVIERPSGICPE